MIVLSPWIKHHAENLYYRTNSYTDHFNHSIAVLQYTKQCWVLYINHQKWLISRKKHNSSSSAMWAANKKLTEKGFMLCNEETWQKMRLLA
jgi:hypothetical protein